MKDLRFGLRPNSKMMTGKSFLKSNKFYGLMYILVKDENRSLFFVLFQKRFNIGRCI